MTTARLQAADRLSPSLAAAMTVCVLASPAVALLGYGFLGLCGGS